jgi:hypothetical protein
MTTYKRASPRGQHAEGGWWAIIKRGGSNPSRSGDEEEMEEDA